MYSKYIIINNTKCKFASLQSHNTLVISEFNELNFALAINQFDLYQRCLMISKLLWSCCTPISQAKKDADEVSNLCFISEKKRFIWLLK